VLFSLRENVAEVIPPKPVQDPAFYQAAWQEYWRLCHAYRRSGLGFGAAVLLLFLVVLFGEKLPRPLGVSFLVICLIALVLSIGFMSSYQWKWLRWRCPRCGCAFRGVWGRLWLPRHCVYCGLPRQKEAKSEGLPC
jgi:hypothetical protein